MGTKYSAGNPVKKSEINAATKDFKSEIKNGDRVTATSISTFLMDSGWDNISIASVILNVLEVEKDSKQMSYMRRTLARSGAISIDCDPTHHTKKQAENKAKKTKVKAEKPAKKTKAKAEKPAKKTKVKAEKPAKKAKAKAEKPAKKAKAEKPAKKAKAEKPAKKAKEVQADIFD